MPGRRLEILDIKLYFEEELLFCTAYNVVWVETRRRIRRNAVVFQLLVRKFAYVPMRVHVCVRATMREMCSVTLRPASPAISESMCTDHIHKH
jgi:hypothetical protein